MAAESLVGPISERYSQDEEREEPVVLQAHQKLHGRTLALGFFSFAWGLANFGFLTWLPTLLGEMGYAGATSSAYLALSALLALPTLVLTTLLFTRWSTRGTLAMYAVAGGFSGCWAWERAPDC